MTKKKRSNLKFTGGKKKSPHQPHRKNQSTRWIGIGIVLIVAIIAVILLIPDKTTQLQISASLAYQKYQEGTLFLDVRSKDEWGQTHIANSISIPLDELPDRLNELPQDKDIVVVCLAGKRSQEGMNILREAGFSRASCMTEGLNAWKAAGYPLESSGE